MDPDENIYKIDVASLADTNKTILYQMKRLQENGYNYLNEKRYFQSVAPDGEGFPIILHFKIFQKILIEDKLEYREMYLPSVDFRYVEDKLQQAIERKAVELI